MGNIEQPQNPELDKKNRYRVKFCPCGKSNKDGKFVPYKGYENKGFCHSCGKLFRPEATSSSVQGNPSYSPSKREISKIQPQNPDIIPFDILEKQLINGKYLYPKNHFISWLGNEERKKEGQIPFSNLLVNKLIESFYLGNSSEYAGWVLFPYIDIKGNLRQLKLMDYDPKTGHRIKEPVSKVICIGKKVLNNDAANLIPSFFGEHRLKGNNQPACIFESEASAIYATPFYPDSICLATGGKYGCAWYNPEIFKVLHGRNVILFPDIDAHEDWELKANRLRKKGYNVSVFQKIKQKALEYSIMHGIDYQDLVKRKYDLRDILIYKDWSKFSPEVNRSKPEPAANLQTISTNSEISISKASFYHKPDEEWEKQIDDI